MGKVISLAQEAAASWIEALRKFIEESRPKHCHRSQVPQMYASQEKDFKRRVNVACIGSSGVGKSSFINAVRNVNPRDEGAAAVGTSETTTEPRMFRLKGELRDCIRFWDLPGGATAKFASANYVEEFALDLFDVLIIVDSDRLTELTKKLYDFAAENGIPAIVIRNKYDKAVVDNEEDYDIPESETRQSIMSYYENAGIKPFLICSKPKRKFRYGNFEDMWKTMTFQALKTRKLPSDKPIPDVLVKMVVHQAYTYTFSNVEEEI